MSIESTIAQIAGGAIGMGGILKFIQMQRKLVGIDWAILFMRLWPILRKWKICILS